MLNICFYQKAWTRNEACTGAVHPNQNDPESFEICVNCLKDALIAKLGTSTVDAYSQQLAVLFALKMLAKVGTGTVDPYSQQTMYYQPCSQSMDPCVHNRASYMQHEIKQPTSTCRANKKLIPHYVNKKLIPPYPNLNRLDDQSKYNK